MSFASKVLSIFPTLPYLLLPAAGLDISDQSVKCVEFTKSRQRGRRVKRFASMAIPRGVVEQGRVIDKQKLIAILSEFARVNKIHYVRASLPEEAGYIFPAHIPEHLTHDETREALKFKIEENVPIALSDAIIDYEVVPDVPTAGGQRMVSVSVYPKKVAEEYVELLSAAGFEVLSLEIEAQAIARAVVPKKLNDVSMVVDLGRARSGIAIVQGQAVRFTATVSVGGDEVDDVLMRSLPDASHDDITHIKNEQGLSYEGEGSDAFKTFAQRLSKEVERYMVYWQTHKEKRNTPNAQQAVVRIIVTGGNANIAGLPEYLERTLRIPVLKGNAWENAFSLDAYIPDIAAQESLGYTPAIGLALHEDE